MEPPKKHVTWDEMLALEAETGLRHEFQRGCEVFPADLRLWIPAIGRATYADASLFCEPESDVGRQALLNPTIIVEVLSPSTADYDRGDKFQAYRTLPSLRHVLFVASTRIAVTHAWQEDDRWGLRDHVAGDALRLAPFGSVEVDELYAGWSAPPND